MGKKHREGFTLIELLVLMMVVAIALGIGVPAFRDMTANGRMAAAANDLVSSLHAARGEALTRSRSVTLCASSDWDAERPSCDGAGTLFDGWIVFVDVDTDGTVDDGEAIVQAHGPLHVSIAGAARSAVDGGPPQYIAYRADGMLQDIAGLGAGIDNVQFCDGRGPASTGGERAAGRWITLSPAGRPTLIDKHAVVQGGENPLGGC